MCRRNQLRGCCLIALGLGMLLGHCLESLLICVAIGLGALVLGFGICRQR